VRVRVTAVSREEWNRLDGDYKLKAMKQETGLGVVVQLLLLQLMLLLLLLLLIAGYLLPYTLSMA
jgi:hypothetical protein